MFLTEKIVKYLLYFTLLIPPLSIAKGLLFPFVSGKAYLFRFGVEIALFFWVILLIKEPKYRFDFKNLLVISGFLYILAMSVTAILGVDWIHSFFSEIERADGILQFIHWFLYFLMLASVFKTDQDWDYFIKSFLFLSVIISLFAWGQHFSTSPFFFYGRKIMRLEGTFGNADYLPAFLLFSMGFTIYYLFEAIKKKAREYKNIEISSWLLLFVFFFLTFLGTQTRGAYAGFLAGFLMLVALFSVYERKEYKKIIIGFWIIILVGALSWGAVFAFRKTNFVKNNSLLYRLVDISPKTSGSLKGRILTWKIAYGAIKEKPFFGWGPENFAEPFSRFYYLKGKENLEAWFDKVHNQFIQVATEGGLFQLSFYLFWVVSVFYIGFKTIKNSKDKIVPIVLVSIYFSFIIQDIFLFDTFPLYAGLWPFLGFVYYNYEKSKQLN